MINDYTATTFIVNDKSLELETNNFFKRFLNIFFVPILNNLPVSFKKYIKKSSAAAAKVIENATNHDALEILYCKGNISKKKPGVMTKLFQYVWFNLDNSKAVRNRLKIVMKEMHKHLESIASRDKEINIVSLASGSSRAVVEVVQKSNYLRDTKLSITFLDKNPKAIEYSKSLCKDIHSFELKWINDTVGNFLRSEMHGKYDIVEIVGLFDYFTDEKIEEALRGIYNILQEGGIVITANINHNKEEKFITNVISWPMVYRSAEELASLALKAGFRADFMKVFYEPLKVHSLVVAKK
jgi:SAM-dependent methyltransferase